MRKSTCEELEERVRFLEYLVVKHTRRIEELERIFAEKQPPVKP